MKKFFTALLCVTMVLGIAGCSSDDGKKEEKKEEKKKDVYAIGETAEADGIKITVNSTRIDEGLLGASEDGTVYFVIDVSLENTTDESFSSSSMMCYDLKDGDGRKQDLTIGATLNGSLDTEIAAGEKGAGEIAFKVAPEGSLTLTFKPAFGDSVKITVR